MKDILLLFLIFCIVYSKSIKWIPQGSQEEVFKGDLIRVCQDDIVITKMRPGQDVDIELHCVKGFGKDHAKWSPVSCATYRLMPVIDIIDPITGDDAHKFANCFPSGVIKIQKVKGVDTAVVADARKDTVSRECLRHPEFANKVVLSRISDHFIYHFETTGFFEPVDVVRESLLILLSKCEKLRTVAQFL